MNLRSPEPYWLMKNGIMYSYPSLSENIECEILIIGGGITGALMLDAVRNEGYDTVIVDALDIATGSTAASTSMLQYEIDVALIDLQKQIGVDGANKSYLACRDAIYELEKIIEKHQIDCGFTLKRSLYFAHDEDNAKWLKDESKTRKEIGLAVNWLESKAVEEQYKVRSNGGIISEDGASMDPYKFTKELIELHSKKGAKIYDQTPITSVRDTDTGIEAKTDTHHVIHANKVIYCTGYETQKYLKEKIVSLFSTYACVSEKIENLPEVFKQTLYWNTQDPYIYLRTTDDNRLVMGGCDKPFRNAFLRDLFISGIEKKLLADFKKYFIAEELTTDYVWSGTFGSTEDGLPYIGSYPDKPNSLYALGFGGNGILFSVLARDILVKQLKGETSDLAQWFRFGR